jgi:hypothetical protein
MPRGGRSQQRRLHARGAPEWAARGVRVRIHYARRPMRHAGDEGTDEAQRDAWFRRRRHLLVQHAGIWGIVSLGLLIFALLPGAVLPLWIWWAAFLGSGAGVAIHGFLILTLHEDDWAEERARREKRDRAARGAPRRRVEALPPERARVAADTGSGGAAEEEAASEEAREAERPRRRE